MTDTASLSVAKPGRFRRAFAVVWAFVQAMDSSSFDYTQDRLDRLERKVVELTEELRQGRASGPHG